MTTARDVVGDAVYLRIIKQMQQASPDVKSVVHEQHADALILHLWTDSSVDDATCSQILGKPRPPLDVIQSVQATVPTAGSADAFTYYTAHATHTRFAHPAHSFMNDLPLVRVPLAAKTADAVPISTSIGQVIPQDHLFASVSQLSFKYGDDLGYDVARIDLITPARSGGARFGAIALYLGYKNASDASPSFYVLEAGTATGEARVAFISPEFGVIPAEKKWYQPTPFTTEDAYYAGKLIMNGDDPDQLIVNALGVTKQPEVQVSIAYEKVATPLYIWPAFLTLMAAARIGLIAVERGQLEFEDILAPIGALLPWLKPPSA
jgi:hypothetical protein